MNNKLINRFSLLMLLFAGLAIGSCEKETYSFGDIKTPANLQINTAVAGVNADNPNGDGTGVVNITATADNALSYKIDYGDGRVVMVPSGIASHQYNTPGVNDYNVTVTAIGTGGAQSTLTQPVKVYVAFNIPTAIAQGLTGGGSRTWMIDPSVAGHFGVGPADGFSPSWYAAPPDTREACAYDNELTFTLVGDNAISLTRATQNESFSTAASNSFYGVSGGDNCYAITVDGTTPITFMNANSGSTSANSTGIAFEVPGNGILAFGTGSNRYEILSISDTQMVLRNIGSDGNSWYQTFKVK